ncbi:MAG: hypothetical protein NZ561_02135, partial [Phycisphaerae bacterium]|nr:hypothetical protein [Phycisphaerae bacterium]
MSRIRPTLSEFQEPEPGTQLEVGLGEFGKKILWMLLLATIAAVAIGVIPFVDASRGDPPARPGF